MKRIEILYGVVTVGVLAGSLGIPLLIHGSGSTVVPGWPALVSPGPLSPPHEFLANRCESCHAPHAGIRPERCVVCHAGDQALLRRQPTAFHATVSGCAGCHIEHLEADLWVRMDHTYLASLRSSGSLTTTQVDRGEMTLDCGACHANEDVHRARFGTSCVECHATDSWTISRFRHPSPRSTDCVQCHEGPPSHYMGHFDMVSRAVAQQPEAQQEQCFVCHQTNDWNDIREVGWYDHH